MHERMCHTYVIMRIFPQEFAIQVYLCSVPLVNESAHVLEQQDRTATIDSISGRLDAFLEISASIARFFGHAYWKNSHQLNLHRLVCGT